MKPNPSYHWDWPAAGLLVAAIFTAAVRLNSTNWTPDLGYVIALGVLGTILGLALGISRFRSAALFWLVSGYSLIIIPSQLAQIIIDEKTAIGQLASLLGRVASSIGLLLSGNAIDDHIFFVTQMCILFWAIGLYSGYRLIRRPGVFPVLLPSTLPVLIIQYYDGYKSERIWGLAFYFFLALLLTGRMNLLKSRERWADQRVVVGSDPEFDLSKNMAIAAAVIILATWLLPAPVAVLPAAVRAWRNFNAPFESTRQRLNDMLAALHGQSSDNSSGELYGSVMSLGRDAGSGETELFHVSAPQNDLPRLYWRVRTYDIYLNGSWHISNSVDVPFNPDKGNLARSEIMPVASKEFVFNWVGGRSSMLVTPSLPVWASRTGSIQIAGDNVTNTDPLGWYVTSSLLSGDQYHVRALLLNPSRKDLRNSGDSYPDWIKERYLQVPANISMGLNQLATQIAAGKLNNFDKAEAVTYYLRQNMTYAETIPAPPPGLDPVNWFLYDWKSGFCNYYATANVLLLRSLGIPARMVVGYAQGKSDKPDVYIVRGQDAHAWPEAYFPGIGWVEFEPTTIQQPISRPSGDDAVAQNQSSGFNSREPHNPLDGLEPASPTDKLATNGATSLVAALELVLWVIISMVALGLVGVLIWQLERRQSFRKRVPRAVKAAYNRYNLKSPIWVEHWVRWSEVSSVERSFHAINQALTWLHRPQPDYATPAERAVLLKSLIPEASADIESLTTALEQTFYTAHAVDHTNAVRQSWMIRFFAVRKLILGRFYGE